jgi:hypothetical protein
MVILHPNPSLAAQRMPPSECRPNEAKQDRFLCLFSIKQAIMAKLG